jgi:hypothetical protein
MRKTRFVEVGAWRTLEWFWGGKGRAVFLGPARAEIKVRYGNGWVLGEDRQHQTLNGLHPRELKVRLGSLVYARMQILVPRSRQVTYDFYPQGNLGRGHGDGASLPG